VSDYGRDLEFGVSMGPLANTLESARVSVGPYSAVQRTQALRARGPQLEAY
jgi:hypothetical protein